MDKNFNDSLLGGNSNESYIIDNHSASNNSSISFKTNFDNNYNDNNDYNNDRNISTDENDDMNIIAGTDVEAAALYAKSIKINKSVESTLHLKDKIKIYQLSRTINVAIDGENDSMNVNVSSNNHINLRNSKSKSRGGDGKNSSHNKTIEFCDYAPHVFDIYVKVYTM